MGIIQDDRSKLEGRRAFTFLVGGRDSFMSGWGRAEGGASWAFWACRPEDRLAVERWVADREELRYRRTIELTASEASAERIRRARLPRNFTHLHVYTVTAGHPALEGGA